MKNKSGGLMDRSLIDTDILSYYFRGDETVVHNFKKYHEKYDHIEFSLITYYEIASGLPANEAVREHA